MLIAILSHDPRYLCEKYRGEIKKTNEGLYTLEIHNEDTTTRIEIHIDNDELKKLVSITEDILLKNATISGKDVLLSYFKYEVNFCNKN